MKSRIAPLFPAVLLVVSPAIYAQKPPAPPAPNPRAPGLNVVAPYGMQRGTKLALVLTGTNLTDPVSLWTSFPAKATIPTDMNNGQDKARLRVLLDVPPDAPLGLHTIRLATAHGMSNLRAFCIDDLPQVAEADSNRNQATPQELKAPCVVVGRADAEATDHYNLSVSAGQRLSFEIVGRRLGSLLDPQITLYDARTGKDLSGGFSNDAPGLQTDARLTHTFREAGEVLIEVRDVLYRGGADYYYRLRIGDFPCATTPYPLAITRGSKARIGFAGPNVADAAPVEVSAPADLTETVVWVAPKGASGLHGWPVALFLSDLPESAEEEPNNDPTKPMKVAVPGGISARFHERGDVDHYVLPLKKGVKYAIEVQTTEYFSPADVFLALRDAKSAQVAASDPDKGARFEYTPPADGNYTLVVEHLHFLGGPDEVYHLTVRATEQTFDLSVALERGDAAQGGTFAFPILTTRRGYTGPIEVSVVGPAGLSGQVTIPAGQPKAPNTPGATLTVTVGPEVPVGPHVFSLVGKATVDGKEVTSLVTCRTVVSQFMGNLPFPPPEIETRVALAVTARPPFVLGAKFDAANVEPGKPITATVTATRAPGFAEEIVLNATGLPATVKATLKNIGKGQNEVQVQFDVAPNAAAGTFPITFTGKAKVGPTEITDSTDPVSLVVSVVPFELKAEPAAVTLAQGGKVKVKVTATRKNYPGPITLSFKNLPAGVSATSAALAQNATVIEVELTAAANAAPVEKAEVSVVGVATGAGNATRGSPNFTVSVTKK